MKGSKLTGPNGKSIFLPAAGSRNDTYLTNAGTDGYYWSSSLNTDYYLNYAWYVFFYAYDVYSSSYRRCYGLSIRPVSE